MAAMINNDDKIRFYRKLGTRLRQQREALGYAQQDVARDMGWHRQKLHRIESGRGYVSVYDLRLLAAYYGQSVDPFITEDEFVPKLLRSDERWLVYPTAEER